MVGVLHQPELTQLEYVKLMKTFNINNDNFLCKCKLDDYPRKDYMEFGYVKPWNRFSPYIVGILLGYILHITKRKTIKLSKV